jgi:uncharacterized membrane protein YdjX (TVP38/TMEM64 family)
MILRSALLTGLAILGLATLGIWIFAPWALTEALSLLDRARVAELVARAGIWGPVLIITLMTFAVVASPIPSAPIALAAGAAYGHLWGAVQVVIGAELGALIAFGLARVLGHDALRRAFGDRVDAGRPNSLARQWSSLFTTSMNPGYSSKSNWGGCVRLNAL